MQPLNRSYEAKTGAYCSLSSILAGSRIAEISKDAVAHKLLDKAAEPRDLFAAKSLVSSKELVHMLRIHGRREGRRADQIAEHDSELPPLCLYADCGLWFARIVVRGNGCQ